MAENEKLELQEMAEAIAQLPKEKKAYFLGFAKGVAAMASLKETQTAEGAA